MSDRGLQEESAAKKYGTLICHRWPTSLNQHNGKVKLPIARCHVHVQYTKGVVAKVNTIENSVY